LGFPIHKPYKELTKEQQELIWKGGKNILGLDTFFAELERQQVYKIQARVMLSRYKSKVTCHDCNGTRIRKDAQYVKINGKSIADLVLLPIQELAQFVNELKLNEHETKIAGRILTEIRNRVGYLQQVGLGYLTLNRLTSTLSGGEFQRIKLATSLGSALVGSMYILDEPSIGLHPRDTQQLIAVLKYLRNLGNSVIVVEHEEEIMKAADQIIEIGPAAGTQGGQLMWQANIQELNEKSLQDSPTLRFLTGKETIDVPTFRRKALQFIHIKGAAENNLKNIDVTFPLGVFTAVTGVSGSGKSTLIRRILYPSLLRSTGQQVYEQVGKLAGISGDLAFVKGVEMIDQNPIGRSSRSNPVTYLKAFDGIRELFAAQPLSKQRGYKPGFFSFNVPGGRCETCEGEGTTTIEMQFMADIVLPCEACKGTRYKQETLEVKYQGKSIADVLNMTVDEAVDFFENEKKIKESLLPLQQVGLGYVSLGQSGNTLSGGEAQRIKLASFLEKGSEKENGIVFIFDEPTTGLHFADIKRLLVALQALVDNGNTVIVIEHNTEIIKCADYVIDLGEEGGDAGGYLVFAGTPEALVQNKKGHTARFLKEKLAL
jgi:excinuclease ABC subunit A